MSKRRKVSEKGLRLVAQALPTKYKSKAGLAAAALGLLVSLAAVYGADRPEVAAVIQALTVYGFIENGSE